MTAAVMITVLLSVLLAAAELFSKFRDEPFLLVKSLSAWAYIVLNILIALCTLYLLTRTDILGISETRDLVKAAFISGLGSAVLMRSKFLKINAGGKENAIGPEIIINVFMETLESRIDRERALSRKTLVEKCMADIDFEKTWTYVITTIQGARQIATPESITELLNEVEKIQEGPLDPVNKSQALGYLVLDIIGEAFLKNLFTEQNKQGFSSPSNLELPEDPGQDSSQ